MAKRNLFKKLNNPSSEIPLRPFDLSQRKVYSSRVGMCVPELAMEVVKGDKIKIDTTVFNRTEVLLKPAFFRCKQFHHFFFVPYHTLWHEWDAFFTRSTEKLSSATLGSSYFPNFPLQAFLDEINRVGGSSDMMGYRDEPGIDRMMQMLHYAGLDAYDEQARNDKYCNLARILAYNKIWYWYYRDKRHQAGANGTMPYRNNFVKLYNVDDVDSSTFATSHLDPKNVQNDYDRLSAMFEPKYRTWDSDLFTNSFADTQFGSVSVLNADKVVLSNLAQLPEGTTTLDYYVGIYRQSTSDTGKAAIKNKTTEAIPSNGTFWSIPNLFDILQLRKAEAVQHWRELMLRAGDSSRDRYTAMFGSHPNRSEEAPNYIGGFDTNLNVDDVTSTAYDNQQSAGNQYGLGDLAGKGIMASSGQKLEFTAPDFGIVMCISSILPLAEYDGTCIDKANMLIEPTDFYIPQYDKLGFEPIVRAEQVCESQGWAYVDNIIGYTVRNHYLKTAVDRVYNNFRTGKNENYWCCTRRNLYYSYAPSVQAALDYRNYYVSPDVVNNLFDRQCNPTTAVPSNAYSEDQFKCLTYFDIKALRPMSELGLPPL